MSNADKLFQHQSDLQTVQRQCQLDWKKQTREAQLSAVLWPKLTSEGNRKAMAGYAQAEGKAAPKLSPLLSDRERGCVSPLGNVAKQSGRK
jgi:hypothetical protein